MDRFTTGSGRIPARIRRPAVDMRGRRALVSHNNTRPQFVSGGVLARSRRARFAPSVLPVISFVVAAALICASLGVILLASQAFTPGEAKAASNTAPDQPAGIEKEAIAISGAAPAKGRVNILLLGSDRRAGDTGFRTDVILLVSIDTGSNAVSVVSFPRDLWVESEMLYPMKINMLHGLGGFEAVAGAFEQNFGVHIDHYVMTDFEGFVQIIDQLGGIDVHAAQPLVDSCDLPQAVGGQCEVSPGIVHMDGATALWYVRSRATSSDYDRLRRAQEVVLAGFARLIDLNMLGRLPELQASFAGFVETDLGLHEVTPLLPAALQAASDPDRIRRFAIGEEQAVPFWSWDGMWILLPDQDAIRALLIDAGILPGG